MKANVGTMKLAVSSKNSTVEFAFFLHFAIVYDISVITGPNHLRI
jgi:hypothetical protein